MKYFLDAEFIEDGVTIDLLSLALVDETGLSRYWVNTESDHSKASPWVKEHVLPRLYDAPENSHVVDRPRKYIAQAVREFIGDEKPDFWGYFADYDWVVFCQLFGTMMDLPKGFPMYCRDIKQLCDSLSNPQLPAQGKGEHHALLDARWNKTAYEFLMALEPHRNCIKQLDWEKLLGERDAAKAELDRHVLAFNERAKFSTELLKASNEMVERVRAERDVLQSIIAVKNEALKMCGETEAYFKELDDAKSKSKKCEKEGDTHGYNFFEGLHNGIIARQIPLSCHVAKAITADECALPDKLTKYRQAICHAIDVLNSKPFKQGDIRHQALLTLNQSLIA